MYLSSGETFMISLVITLIAGLIYVMLRGQDDDHDQGAGAVGACPFSSQGLPIPLTLAEFCLPDAEGQEMGRGGQEMKETFVKLRVIGLRENEIFHIKWYDPNHEFYPTNKK